MDKEQAEKIADALAYAIDRAITDNKLEAMWSPEIVEGEIPMSETELDEFLKTFANDKKMQTIQEYIKDGAQCETHHTDNEGNNTRCEKKAIGTVDFYGITFLNSVIVCRDDIRSVYRSIITEDLGREGLKLALSINGKEIPRIPIEENIYDAEINLFNSEQDL